jgi:hypothetical protein
MNDSDNTQGQALTTEQIAAGNSGPAQHDVRTENVPAQAGRNGYDDNEAPFVTDDEDAAPFVTEEYDNAPLVADDDDAPLVAEQGAPRAADRTVPDAGGSVAADAEPRASLLEEGELQSMTMRWKDIQAEFVDEPTTAIQEADALVAELMQRLASMFAAERADLEERLSGDNQVSTEDLRQGLRHYRSFFERLLAA